MRFRSRNAFIAFVIIFSVLLVNAVLTYINVHRLHRSNELVSNTHEVQVRLVRMTENIVSAEAAMRGYLLIFDATFLPMFEEARNGARADLQQVLELMRDERQRDRMAVLERLVDERLDLMDEYIQARNERGLEAGQELVRIGRGRAKMAEVRAVINEIETEQNRILQERIDEAQASFITALVSALVSSGLGMGLAAAGYMLVVRELTTRDEAAAQMEQTNAQLEARVQERTASIQQMNVALIDEVEERRRAEEQARAVAVELQRSNRELEQFASVASHDLQEPLRKIQAFGDRLRAQFHENLGEKGQDYLDRILTSSARMRKLIDDLLTFSRVATKAQPFTAVDLKQLADEVVGDLEHHVGRDGATITIDQLPTIDADPLQMRQLLQNLIGNGLKFKKPDVPPLVTVSSRMIADPSGESTVVGTHCEITVSDNGIGFEQVYAKRIFELFQRLHSRNEFEGTGMGLAICRKIVERHGGTISAHSAPGQGAQFVVVLPVKQADSGVAA